MNERDRYFTESRGGGKKKIFDRIPREVLYIATVYLTGMVCFTLCRLILLWRNFALLDFGVDNSAEWICRALLMGVRFDNVISGYLLSLPVLLLLAGQIFPRMHRTAAQMSKWYLLCLLPRDRA